MKKIYHDDAVYEYVKSKCQRGVPPSIREICDDLNISSTSTVHQTIKSLVQKGAILKDGRHTRSIRLPGTSSVYVPIVRSFQDGKPVLDYKEIDGYMPVHFDDENTEDFFAIKKEGKDMEADGIFDQDLVIFDQDRSFHNNKVAAVLIDDHVVIRRFFREGSMYRLEAASKDISPIFTDHCFVLGYVRACLRYYK